MVPGWGARTSSKEFRSLVAKRPTATVALVWAGFVLGCSGAGTPPRTEASTSGERLTPRPHVKHAEPSVEQSPNPIEPLSLPRLHAFEVEARELLVTPWERPLAPEGYRESQVLLGPAAKSQVAAGAWALAMVDDFAPRRIRVTRELRLGDLVPEDRELTQGAHLLVIALGEEPGTLAAPRLFVQTVAFSLGAKDPSAPSEGSAPACRILHPFGTHHGPESIQALRFLAISTETKKETIQVQVDGRELTSEGVLPETGVAYSLGMLNLGDHDISCRLKREGSAELRRAVTLTPLVVPKKEERPRKP